MDLMSIRRGLLAGKNAMKPIYSIYNYSAGQGKLDTGVSLVNEGTKGYTIIIKVDCDTNTIACSIINGAGIYRPYCFLYPNRNPSYYGIKGNKVDVNYFPGTDFYLTWLKALCVTVNLEEMTTCAFLNDEPAKNGTITEVVEATKNIVIFPDNRKDAHIMLNKLEIYPYSMTEAQMRKLVQ